VPFGQNLARLAPRSTPRQTCREHRLNVQPEVASSSRREDYFGNMVDYFSVRGSHLGLRVTAESVVDVEPVKPPQAGETPPWETVAAAIRTDHSAAGLGVCQLALPSMRVRMVDGLADYAAVSFPADRPIVDAIVDLNSRIHADFTFDPRATTINTPLGELLAIRRGVCQDFAHLMIGCLRTQGLAARYVSGYICTTPPPGKPRLVGADASHAWISAYCGPLGWVDVDPTNNSLVSDAHVTVAWGRDYDDVCPIQGVFAGGGKHTMGVNVDVIPESELKQTNTKQAAN
jgi:transglutaminase-like putative cysteine protease